MKFRLWTPRQTKLAEARGETSQREIAKVMCRHGIPLTYEEISKAEKGYIYLSPKAEDIACKYLKAPYLYTKDELQCQGHSCLSQEKPTTNEAVLALTKSGHSTPRTMPPTTSASSTTPQVIGHPRKPQWQHTTSSTNSSSNTPKKAVGAQTTQGANRINYEC